MAAVETVKDIPWWKEPTKEQWYAWWAAWLGWTLDAFDFTVFLLIMVPISQEFNVPLTVGSMTGCLSGQWPGELHLHKSCEDLTDDDSERDPANGTPKNGSASTKGIYANLIRPPS